MPRKNMIVYLEHYPVDALEIQNAARADEEDAAHSQDAKASADYVRVLLAASGRKFESRGHKFADFPKRPKPLPSSERGREVARRKNLA